MCSSFDSYNNYFSLAVAKLRRGGIAMVLFYLVSLEKPEFTEFAKRLSARTTLEKCFATAWTMSLGYRYEGEADQLVKFLQEHCSNNEWNFDAWLKLQSDKVVSLFKLKEKTT